MTSVNNWVGCLFIVDLFKQKDNTQHFTGFQVKVKKSGI